MRAKPIIYGLNEDRGTPAYVCPSCGQIGLGKIVEGISEIGLKSV